jgi:hypothetical protein
LLCNEELQWVLLLKKKTSTFAKISGTTKLNPLLLRIVRRLYIKDLDFSETLKRQSLNIWSHIESILCHPFTGKLKCLGKDNYYSGVEHSKLHL